MTEKTTKSQKRLVRLLQELRGCTYQTALNELRGLPAGTKWSEHIKRVALEETPEDV